MNVERCEDLVFRYFDESLTPAERRELEGGLEGSEEARRTFWELAKWHASLWSWAKKIDGRGGSK